MPLPVSLHAVVGDLQLVGSLSTAYLNRRTGEVAILTEEDALLADADTPLTEWERDWAATARAVQASEDWLALPDRFELHPYQIMERFCLSIPTHEGGEALLAAIRGRGAFRQFRDQAGRLGLEARWFAFQDDAYRRIVAVWLEAHEIPFRDDVPRASAHATHAQETPLIRGTRTG